jgi:hypothetical protein
MIAARAPAYLLPSAAATAAVAEAEAEAEAETAKQQRQRRHRPDGIIGRWPLSLPDESQSLVLSGDGFQGYSDDDDDDANDCSVRDGSERGAIDGQGESGDRDKDRDRGRGTRQAPAVPIVP